MAMMRELTRSALSADGKWHELEILKIIYMPPCMLDHRLSRLSNKELHEHHRFNLNVTVGLSIILNMITPFRYLITVKEKIEKALLILDM